MKEMKIMSLTGFLGYGYPKESFARGMTYNLNLIGADSGSIDPGPYYLGSGKSLIKRAQLKRDLAIALKGARERNIPLVTGSAGTSGGEPHLKFVLDLLMEIAAEEGLHFRVAVIHSEIDKKLIKKALSERKVNPYPRSNLPHLREEDVDKTVRIVGQMGIQPYIRAFQAGVDVIIAGRSCDTAIFAALPILKGFDKGLAFHLAKIMECGTLCATPGAANDSLLGILREDCFIVEPLNPRRRCTKLSVAAHSLYEQQSPFEFYEPEGKVDISGVAYEQLGERKVQVCGSKFIPAEGSSTIKLEGVKHRGYHSISIAGIRDPLVIEHLDELEAGVRWELKQNLPDEILEDWHAINFRFYGVNGVLGKIEPNCSATPYEVGILIEGISSTQENADIVCALARSTALHYGFEGRKCTAGNLAFPFSPSDFQGGPVYEFSLYHLMEVEDPGSLFKVELITL